MLKFESKGNFKNIEKFLSRAVKINYEAIFEKYGQEGIQALAMATPIDTGETALSWNYKIRRDDHSISIIWTNSNIVDGVPIAVILQYGHATRNGGYVEGRDYINPALKPIFDRIANKLWEEVSRK